jgi:hypothetical protein
MMREFERLRPFVRRPLGGHPGGLDSPPPSGRSLQGEVS